MKNTCLSLFLLLSSTETLGLTQRQHKKTLKDRRREAGCRTGDLRSDVAVSSLGFLLTSSVPHMELKKLATRNANECGQEKPQQKPSMCSQRTKKALCLSSKTENFSVITARIQPNTTVNTSSSWELGLPPHWVTRPPECPQRPRGRRTSQGCVSAG